MQCLIYENKGSLNSSSGCKGVFNYQAYVNQERINCFQSVLVVGLKAG